MAATVASKSKKKTFKLNTQVKRAAFGRRELRKTGWSINELAEESGLSWITVARFLDLAGGTKNSKPTRLPRFETVKSLFNALGYDVTFTAKGTKGIVEL